MVARPLPDLPGVYYSIVVGVAETKPSNNIFTFQQVPAAVTGAPDVLVADQVATSLLSNYAAFAANEMPQAYVNTLVKTYALHTPLAPPSQAIGPNNGGVIGDIMPLWVGARIQHDVYRRGKGSQSGTTFSPINSIYQTADGESLDIGKIGTMNTRFANLIAGMIGDLTTAAGGLWSYVQLSKGTGTHAPTTYPILASSCESLLSSQRRRLQR